MSPYPMPMEYPYMQNPYMNYPYMQWYPMQQYPCYPQFPQFTEYPMPKTNPQAVITQVNPVVQYGMSEAEFTSVRHAMMEVALITYLMGTGYDFRTAHAIVEEWEALGYFRQ